MPDLGVCRTCGRGVSSEAVACPGCGQPNPYRSARYDDLRTLCKMMYGGCSNKIEAIKEVRRRGVDDLREAKSIVDDLDIRTRGLSRPEVERIVIEVMEGAVRKRLGG